MARAKPSRKAEFDETLCVRIDALRKDYPGQLSFSAMSELLMTAIVNLIETRPDHRRLPPIVAAIDAVRTSQPVLSSSEDRVAAVTSGLLGVAISQVKKAAK